MVKRTDIDTSVDGEKDGISSNLKQRDDPNFDPSIRLVSQEQVERSEIMERKGVHNHMRELDERDPDDKQRPVAGISALAVDDGAKKVKKSSD